MNSHGRDLISSRQFARSERGICRRHGTQVLFAPDPASRGGLSYDLPSLRDCLSRTLGATLILIALCGTSYVAFAGSPAARKQQARTQFETAERMREALNGRPESERTRKDYQKVADAYRKVYYVSPASSKADASVMAVAEILAEMGRQFAPDEKDLHASIGEYEFLRREYPGSKYRVEALFTIGQIYKQDLGDDTAAKATFEEFLKKYPHNPLSTKAQDALAELNHPKPKKNIEAAAKNDSVSDALLTTTAAKKATAPRVTGIRFWSTADYTRVAIDLDAEVKYEAGRVPDPDRIFFDLPDTRLVSTLVGKSFDVQDGFLKKIRVAQYQKGSTRVVLEVDDVTEYSAFLLPNPYRLIIDIHGKNTKPTTQVAANLPAEGRRETGVSGSTTAANSSAAVKPDGKASVSASAGSVAETAARSEPKTSASAAKLQNNPSTEAASSATTTSKQPATTTTAFKSASGELTAESKSAVKPAAVTARATTPTEKAESDSVDDTLAKATTKPTTAPTAVTVVPEKKSSGSKRVAKTSSSGEMQTVHAAVAHIGRRSQPDSRAGTEDRPHRD